MDQQLRELVIECAKGNDKNPLWPNRHMEFCERHGITVEHFCYLFARLVAEDFARGEMVYVDGDAAMNSLFGIAVLEITGFSMEIFEAFDSGEYLPQNDPPNTIPWQKYTLPYVMEALESDKSWPPA